MVPWTGPTVLIPTSSLLKGNLPEAALALSGLRNAGPGNKENTIYHPEGRLL